MSKSFREGYYEDDYRGMKKVGKSNKQGRQKVKDYLRKIDFNNLEEIDDDVVEMELGEIEDSLKDAE